MKSFSKITFACLSIYFSLFTVNLSAQFITAGSDHSMAVCNDGTVMAWGKNQNGQLGNGTNTDSSVPVVVGNLNDVIALAAGENFTIALKSDGTVWAWGDNTEGQLGNGPGDDNNQAVQISNLVGIVAIAAGDYHALALKNDGTVWAWGWNNDGQYGNGTDTDNDIPDVSGGLSTPDVVAMDGGAEHTVVLTATGQVLACGENFFGQLGNSTNDDSFFPQQVGFATNDNIAIAAGDDHSIALKSNGTVFTWGDNFYGQLGNGSQNASNFPVQVGGGLTDAVAIAAGNGYSLAIRSNGTVVSWGNNFFGQLGNGTNNDTNLPGSVSSLTDVVEITAGLRHCLALKNDGTVYSWGSNLGGQLGNNTKVDSNIPVIVQGLCLVGPTAVVELKDTFSYSLFPNPSDGHFNINLSQYFEPVGVELMDLHGRLLSSKLLSSSINQVDFSSMAPGVYFLRLKQGDTFITEKLVIR